jgi:protein-tyrosine phosphatase
LPNVSLKEVRQKMRVMTKSTSNWIKRNYGSKKGLLKACWYKLLYKFGFFKAYSKIDWPRINRIVFVCQGNICRSPLAEYYARSLGVDSVSCGLACQNNFSADPRAVSYGKSLGMDMSVHKTTHIDKLKFGEADLVVGMEPIHLKGIMRAEINKAQVTLAGLWLNEPKTYIHDPFSTQADYFSRCESVVVKSAGAIVEQIRR